MRSANSTSVLRRPLLNDFYWHAAIDCSGPSRWARTSTRPTSRRRRASNWPPFRPDERKFRLASIVLNRQCCRFFWPALFKLSHESWGPVLPFQFFLVLACHRTVLDGLNWQYRASVHCSKQCRQLISATSSIKFLGAPRIEPGAAEWELSLVPLCYAPPSTLWNLIPWVPKIISLHVELNHLTTENTEW